MDQKKAKITYIISTAIYAALFLFGLGMTYYSQFIDTDRFTLAGQTLYWIVMMTGPLGIASHAQDCPRSPDIRHRVLRILADGHVLPY